MKGKAEKEKKEQIFKTTFLFPYPKAICF